MEPQTVSHFVFFRKAKEGWIHALYISVSVDSDT